MELRPREIFAVVRFGHEYCELFIAEETGSADARSCFGRGRCEGSGPGAERTGVVEPPAAGGRVGSLVVPETLVGDGCRRIVRRPNRHIDAVEFARTRFRFVANEKQAEILRSTSRRVILNCCRQWGKSTVTVAMALYRAFVRPGCLVIVSSPSKRQSAEWMRKARGMVVRMGIQARGDGDNAVSLLLPNGSRIVGLPSMEDTVRGFSGVSLLLIDEAARVSDQMYAALRPMLATTDGDLCLLSTPRGRSGFFFDTWEYGGPDWLRVIGPATECAQISKRFLEEQRRVMGADQFRQEHMCEFVGRGAGVFDRELVEGILDGDLEPLRL